MWWGYKAMGKAVSEGAKLGTRTQLAVADSLSLRASGRGARRGFLAPGDPTPPPTGATGYLDYRGVATWPEVANLGAGDFPLGRFIDFRGRRIDQQVGVPSQLLHRHAVVVGPSGSGKTSGILSPWIYAGLTAGWSVVAVDVIGDLREKVLAYKAEIGGGQLGAQVMRWDYTAVQRSFGWNWIAELTDEARTDAAVTAILGRPPDKSNVDPFYYQRDYRTLRGLLTFARAALPGVRTPGQLLATLEDDRQLAQTVSANLRAPGADDLAAVLQLPASDYPKAISGVVAPLSHLNTPAVNAIAGPSGQSLDLGQVMENLSLMIVGAPLRGGQVSAALSSLMLNQVTQRLYERFGRPARPVLLVIDEAAQISDRVNLTQLMEVSRSAGAGVVLALQDVAQLRDENDRSSTLSNAATFVMLPGASPKSLEEFGRRLGQRYEQTHGVSVAPASSNLSGGHHRSWSTEVVPVLRDREISAPPFGQRPAVVHVKATELGVTTKPFLVDLDRRP